jgi:thiol-disulfide isomerase/thioredoxin
MKPFILIYFILLVSTANAQQTLNIGDTIPDHTLSMVNYGKPTINFAEFKGKYIILDFWATWCGACVSSFPRIDSMEHEFKNDLVILPVTYEPVAYVQQFLDRQSRSKGFKTTSVVNDVELSKSFPHKELPHYVWIDKNAVVRQISYAESLTRANVIKFIHGDDLKLFLKKDLIPVSADNNSPGNTGIDLIKKIGALNFSAAVQKDTGIVVFHLLSNYVPGFPGQLNSELDTMAFQNTSIAVLYAICYDRGNLKFMGKIGANIELKTADSTRFTNEAGPGTSSAVYRRMWMSMPGHLFCYILKKAKGDSTDRWNMMKKDLSEYFPEIHAKIEKRLKPAYVLKSIGNNLTFKATDLGEPDFKQDYYHMQMHNIPIATLMLMIHQHYQNYQIINETGYLGKINVDIECDFNDPAKVNEALNKFGLSFQKQDEQVDVLVLDDSGHR